MSRLKEKESILGIFLFFILSALLLLNNLNDILFEPIITPESWLEAQPWIIIEILSTSIVLVQPTSTFFVYSLGILGIVIGILLIRRDNIENSVKWWSIALILWGLGALFAGTSYQAFSYEIKCVGREFCLWTSWLEVYYMILSVASVNAMMVAQAYTCVPESKRTVLFHYAIVNMAVYSSIALVGSIIPVRFMVSFELMLLFIVPSILIFVFMNGRRFYNRRQSGKNQMDRDLMVVWISLILIMAAYFLYLILDITAVLWEQGIWFSENDILHIGLIFWMLYIRNTVCGRVQDYTTTQ